jgi:uncharacterized membrane-anchored protein YhcB (DUF1043 family)
MNPIPESNFLLQLMIAAIFIGNLIAIWLGIANGRRIQKREVSFSETPATKKEFDQHVVETARNFNAVRNELAHDRQLNQEHASKRSETLFRKMDATRSELDTKLEDTRRELSQKIDDMPERVIATLKNTGAI